MACESIQKANISRDVRTAVGLPMHMVNPVLLWNFLSLFYKLKEKIILISSWEYGTVSWMESHVGERNC